MSAGCASWRPRRTCAATQRATRSGARRVETVRCSAHPEPSTSIGSIRSSARTWSPDGGKPCSSGPGPRRARSRCARRVPAVSVGSSGSCSRTMDRTSYEEEGSRSEFRALGPGESASDPGSGSERPSTAPCASRSRASPRSPDPGSAVLLQLLPVVGATVQPYSRTRTRSRRSSAGGRSAGRSDGR